MAKAHSFPTRVKTAAKRLVGSRGTFIQRSREESSEQKAIWHNVTGAGRGHVIREFFGLNETERQAAETALQHVLDQRSQSSTR